MFSESKVTEIYCMADDFCKEFALQQEKYMVEDKNTIIITNWFTKYLKGLAERGKCFMGWFLGFNFI